MTIGPIKLMREQTVPPVLSNICFRTLGLVTDFWPCNGLLGPHYLALVLDQVVIFRKHVMSHVCRVMTHEMVCSISLY